MRNDELENDHGSSYRAHWSFVRDYFLVKNEKIDKKLEPEI